MTFSKFEKLVKAKHPEAEIFKHGEFSGNKINVAVIFNPNGKVYKYNGTYCEVLNKLGIMAIYKHDYLSLVAALERVKKEHGKEDMFFGFVIDKSIEIEQYTKRINDLNTNYVIV